MPGEILGGSAAGSGPGVVLLHPVGLDGGFWEGLPARLAETRRVLALDLRGHGGSPPARSGLAMADYADDVARTVEHHGLRPATVIGLSFGGMVAQALALRRPDLVAALVPCGCPGAIPPEAREALTERGHKAERDGMGAIVDETIERWFTPAFRGDARVDAVRRRLASDDPAGWSAAWHAIAGFDALANLPSLRIPALVVAGEHDAATAPAASRALAGALPGSRMTILPGAPHMMQIEAEEAFASAIQAFLDDATARS